MRGAGTKQGEWDRRLKKLKADFRKSVGNYWEKSDSDKLRCRQEWFLKVSALRADFQGGLQQFTWTC